MNPFERLSRLLFRRRIGKFATIGDERDRRIVDFMFDRAETPKQRDHFAEAIQNAAYTVNLQKLVESLCGRKEAGRFLQSGPLVIQCHFCQQNFSDKPDVTFAGPTVNLGSIKTIVEHLTTCDGVTCLCGKKVWFFDVCTCGLTWHDREGIRK